MRNRLGNQAYTIIEILIVLAVSGILLVSAILLVGGQQQKTQFQQSINNMVAQINTVINHVASGYYTNTDNFTCVAGVGNNGPDIQPPVSGGNPQGQNGGCIFIGRAMQFAVVVGTNASQYNTYSLVGLQYQPGTTNIVQSLSDTLPTAISPSVAVAHKFVPNGEETDSMGGLTLVAMHFDTLKTPSVAYPTRALAFIGSLGQVDGNTNNVVSGAQTVGLYGIVNGASGVSVDKTAPQLVNYLDKDSNYLPASDVTLCFQSPGTNQYGIITIGSNGRQLNAFLEIVPIISGSPPVKCQTP